MIKNIKDIQQVIDNKVNDMKDKGYKVSQVYGAYDWTAYIMEMFDIDGLHKVYIFPELVHKNRDNSFEGVAVFSNSEKIAEFFKVRNYFVDNVDDADKLNNKLNDRAENKEGKKVHQVMVNENNKKLIRKIKGFKTTPVENIRVFHILNGKGNDYYRVLNTKSERVEIIAFQQL